MEASVDADAPGSLPDPTGAADAPTATRSTARPSCCAAPSGPVVMAGTGLYWAHGEHALRALCEELQIPVFLNGLARGCVPADDPMFFSRARGTGLKGADVALVVGVPMDFRLGFGGSFGEETQLIVVGSVRARARAPARGGRGALRQRGRQRSTRCAPPAGPTARHG